MRTDNSWMTNEVAMPGDVVLCPSCGAELAHFVGPKMRDIRFLSAGRPRPTHDNRGQLWCECGTGAVVPSADGDVEHQGHLGPRFKMRSGTWIGWRALGGE